MKGRSKLWIKDGGRGGGGRRSAGELEGDEVAESSNVVAGEFCAGIVSGCDVEELKG